MVETPDLRKAMNGERLCLCITVNHQKEVADKEKMRTSVVFLSESIGFLKRKETIKRLEKRKKAHSGWLNTQRDEKITAKLKLVLSNFLKSLVPK